MIYRKIVGSNIRVMRNALGWTQEKLAIRSKIDPDYLGSLERGQVNASIDRLQKIAKILHAPLGSFFKLPEG